MGLTPSLHLSTGIFRTVSQLLSSQWIMRSGYFDLGLTLQLPLKVICPVRCPGCYTDDLGASNPVRRNLYCLATEKPLL